MNLRRSQASAGLRRFPVVILALLAAAALGLSACTAELIAQHDEATVRSVTDLLRKVDSFLIKLERVLETPAGADDARYEKHVAFYDEVRVDLNLIRVRAKALPRNERTVRQIDDLEAALKNFEDLHRQGLNRQVVTTARGIITQAIEAILKAEFAKRRGP
ncbi:MAG: hypothetical protein QN168_12185 [Armatimonadota bacterium]|nr:hypothetical protein [Armatimonadota bacterium]